jgi:hypothetical protein
MFPDAVIHPPAVLKVINVPLIKKSGFEVPAPIVMDDPELKVNVLVAATTHCALDAATLKFTEFVCPVLSIVWVPVVPVSEIRVTTAAATAVSEIVPPV